MKHLLTLVLFLIAGLPDVSAHGRAWIIVAAADAKFKLIPGTLPEGASLIKKTKAEVITEGEGDTLLIFSQPVKPQWSVLSCSFVPEDNGYVNLSIGGDSYQFKNANGEHGLLPAGGIFYDDITLKGAVIRDGGFEGFGPRYNDWRLTRYSEFVSKPGLPRSGKSCLKVWTNAGASQAFAVRKGESVEITLYVKSSLIMESLKDKWSRTRNNLDIAFKANKALGDEKRPAPDEVKLLAGTINEFHGILKTTSNVETHPLDVNAVTLEQLHECANETDDALNSLIKKERDTMETSPGYIIFPPADYMRLDTAIDRIIDLSDVIVNDFMFRVAFEKH